MNIIILDIETTGLSHTSCEITEIGAIKVDSETLEIIEEFSTLIDIPCEVPYFITKLTGITRGLLDEYGIDIGIALRALNEFCGDADVYAHNSSFDKRFIRANLESNSVDFIQTNWIDTIPIFKKAFPGRKTYKLESLIIDYGLAKTEDHRALSDAKHTLTLLKMSKRL